MNGLEVVWFALGNVAPIYLVTGLGMALRRAANIVLISGVLSFVVNCGGLMLLRFWNLI